MSKNNKKKENNKGSEEAKKIRDDAVNAYDHVVAAINSGAGLIFVSKLNPLTNKIEHFMYVGKDFKDEDIGHSIEEHRNLVLQNRFGSLIRPSSRFDPVNIQSEKSTSEADESQSNSQKKDDDDSSEEMAVSG